MKYTILILLLAHFFAVCGQEQSTVECIPINKGWTFSEAGNGNWMEAVVPGTVHQDLIRHKLLPDPFYGLNEKKIQWVENKDWIYKTSFTLTPEQIAREGAQLVFEGLDTYADVYLNGSLILKSDDMFVGYTVPVKEVLRPGENRLQILFHSPIKQTLPQWETNGFEYPADNDHSDKRVSIFSRKAPYSYGWDWGIRMVTSGVWRPITLRLFDIATIDDYHIEQLTLTDEAASIANRLEVNSIATKPIAVKMEIRCSLGDQPAQTVSRDVELQPGKNLIEIPLEILKPERWMPNGWGKPHLYNLTASIINDAKTIAQTTQRIGLRTIKVVNEKDEHGESFYFEVNGIPMFAKGANYIPSDALLPAVTTERYKKLFSDIKEANMNMVRVWGGGVYEDDRFYDLADENGILIWQDFMFGCTSYPADPAFLKRVAEEAEYNIKRLRNHACLAMWCGNNEILEGIKYWGWQSRFAPEVYQQFQHDYRKLFEELLPAQVEKFDSGRFYVHSSPYFANWGRPHTWGTGDSHNWGIWYGKKPFESTDTELGRFISEFGFQAFPEMKTIATFAAPEDYQLESEVMNGHQKSSIGNSLIKTYMERDYIVPEKFEDFVYVGLVLQGRGIRHCIEAQRRNRPYCMGTLYWQLNDSWPVVSWSSIDYYGNWKALHYHARQAFAPVYANITSISDTLAVYLFSDLLETQENLTLELQLTDFQGKKGKCVKLPVSLPANSVKQVFSQPLGQWVTPEDRTDRILTVKLKDRKGNILTENTHYFARTKDLNLPKAKIDYKTRTFDGRCEITLNSKQLAKDVFIQVPMQGAHFSDNFFDLLPGESRKIVITSADIRKGETPAITIKQICDTY